jgi:nucleoside-diphosphate-sugar epimerase
MSKTVLLTGATGFLGSNIARELVKEGYKVYATYRNGSSFERIKDVYNLLTWIGIQNENWINEIEKEQIDTLIHSAWDGVSISSRDDWDMQLRNFEFSKLIFNVAVNCGVNKIISLGSQAEYGIHNEKVSESHVPLPCDAYGAVKLLTAYYLQNLASRFGKDWYWIRVFSVFGKGENETCLIPKVIRSLLNNEPISLTGGNQIYDYLYSDDFVTNFMKILTCKSQKPGIYNLCSGVGIEIKSLLNQIAAKFSNSQDLLRFGEIPYPNNQKMFMVGKSDKFEHSFGGMSISNLELSITKTLRFYQGKCL